MNKIYSLVFLIIASLSFFIYIYYDSNDKVVSASVKYDNFYKKEIFRNMTDDEINSFINEIVDNLQLKKSAKKRNENYVIEKFKEKNLIRNSEDEKFIRDKIRIENKNDLFSKKTPDYKGSFLFTSYGIKSR